jgi:DNA topoisomerase-1
MSKILVVVESYKKGKEIQKYLGDKYVVRESQGHVADLSSTPKNRLGIDIENGFKPIYSYIPNKKDKLDAIIDAASDASEVFLASDPDREGEAISFHIFNALKTKIKAPIRRVMFHEVTKNGVKRGIANPLDLDNNMYDAQQARRVLDRLVGFMVSPFLMDIIGPNLSAGRVQSVTLRMIVDREREIENFKPEEYWSISSTLSKVTTPAEKFVARYSSMKITNKVDANKIKNDLDKDNYEIIDVVAEEKPKKPFPPLETASLQQSASRKYKISSKKTMEIAQSLYESGLITYHRVDSVHSSPDALLDLRDWLKKNGHDIPNETVIYTSKGGNVQGAHEAIRPTNIGESPYKNNLSEDEKKIYSLIWERFVSSQMKPALYDTVSVTIKSSSGHILKANGRTLKYKGWLNIIDAKDDEEEGKLPFLQKGDKLILIPPKVKAEQKFTQPPSRYNEHTLVGELKARGIGRPSTYATILTKVTDRGYAEKKKETYFATDLGKKIVDILVKFFDFMEYKYTAGMEDQLDDIAEGKISYLKMMENFFPKFKDQLKKAHYFNEKDYGINCWKCQSPMRLKHGKFGYYMACAEYEKCKTSRSCEIIDEKPVFKEKEANVIDSTKLVDNVVCPKCASGMIVRDGKFGKFYSCSKYPKCHGSGKIPSGHKCGKCGYDMYITIFDGVSKLACMGYPDCRNIQEIPEGEPSNWINPKTLLPKKNNAVQKILNLSSKT